MENENKRELVNRKIIDGSLPCIERFKNGDLSDAKAFVKFIKKVEKLIRTSLEYRRFLTYLTSELNLTSCSFFKNITKEEKVSIEFHHCPFTLFDITSIVTLKYIHKLGSTNVDTFVVANEVMYLHFQGLIGLVPLTKTLHQLAHVGELYIHPSRIYGNVKDFIKEYDIYIEANQLVSIKNYLNSIDNEDEKQEVLKLLPNELEIKNLIEEKKT
jgi:hypothetical protein